LSYFCTKNSDLPEKAEELLLKINGDPAKTALTKFLRCDNAGENMSKLERICDKFKIQVEYTAPNTPQQNEGV
jgi:hypothetical protein